MPLFPAGQPTRRKIVKGKLIRSAFVPENPDERARRCETILGADASGRHFIQRTGGTMTSLELDPVTGVPRPTEPVPPKLSLMGHDVFVFAVKTMSRITEQLCERRGVTPADLDRVFAHQANGRIIEACARRMKLPLEKFWLNITRPGHEVGSACGRREDRPRRLRGGACVRRHLHAVAESLIDFIKE